MLDVSRPLALTMIQPPPLPGSFRHKDQSFQQIMETTMAEAAMIQRVGFDGYILQNRNDAPVRQTARVESVAYLSVLSYLLKQEFPDLVQGILVNWDGVASIAVAEAAAADFVRVEHVFVGAEVGYAGYLEAQCVEICDFRKRLGSEIPLFADIQEVHYTQIGGKPVPDSAFDAIYNAFADGLFVGGRNPQESIELVTAVRKRIGDAIPIMVSGGSNADNVRELLQHFDGVSVGAWVKNGNMKNPIDEGRAKLYMDAVRSHPRREK